jgi:hypothetical protein
MKTIPFKTLFVFFLLLVLGTSASYAKRNDALSGERFRVLISTDPGQTGWSGRYRPVTVRPKTVVHGHPSLSDKVARRLMHRENTVF